MYLVIEFFFVAIIHEWLGSNATRLLCFEVQQGVALFACVCLFAEDECGSEGRCARGAAPFH